jgi:hypothetical protein
MRRTNSDLEVRRLDEKLAGFLSLGTKRSDGQFLEYWSAAAEKMYKYIKRAGEGGTEKVPLRNQDLALS